MNNQVYGELTSEKIASDNNIARNIVKEINLFGINERQRWIIIHLLAMELENIEDVRALTSFINERVGNNIFVSKIFGSEDTQIEE